MPGSAHHLLGSRRTRTHSKRSLPALRATPAAAPHRRQPRGAASSTPQTLAAAVERLGVVAVRNQWGCCQVRSLFCHLLFAIATARRGTRASLRFFCLSRPPKSLVLTGFLPLLLLPPPFACSSCLPDEADTARALLANSADALRAALADSNSAHKITRDAARAKWKSQIEALAMRVRKSIEPSASGLRQSIAGRASASTAVAIAVPRLPSGRWIVNWYVFSICSVLVAKKVEPPLTIEKVARRAFEQLRPCSNVRPFALARA